MLGLLSFTRVSVLMIYNLEFFTKRRAALLEPFLFHKLEQTLFSCMILVRLVQTTTMQLDLSLNCIMGWQVLVELWVQ